MMKWFQETFGQAREPYISKDNGGMGLEFLLQKLNRKYGWKNFFQEFNRSRSYC